MSKISEQVRELEARAFEAERQVSRCIDERNEFLRTIKAAQDAQRAAESRLAQARVEGAREALTRYCWSDGGTSHRLVSGGDCEYHASGNCRVLRFRDREYPAVPEGGRDVERCGCWAGPNGGCDESCRPTPTPERTFAPSRIWLPLEEAGAVTELKVCITPRDAANIVLMADLFAENPDA